MKDKEKGVTSFVVKRPIQQRSDYGIVSSSIVKSIWVDQNERNCFLSFLRNNMHYVDI